MLLSAFSVLVVAQSSSEVPEGLMNNPVFQRHYDPSSALESTDTAAHPRRLECAAAASALLC